jgi:hypothetical protein
MKERTLLDYWLVLYRRKWIIGLIVLSAMVTAWILSKTVAPFYEAKAVFFVPAKADAVTFLAAPGVSTSKGGPPRPLSWGSEKQCYSGTCPEGVSTQAGYRSQAKRYGFCFK